MSQVLEARGTSLLGMGGGRVVLVADFARAAKGPVNLSKESRIYLEGDSKYLMSLMQGVTRSDLHLRSRLQSRECIGEGHSTGQGAMELIRIENHQDLVMIT